MKKDKITKKEWSEMYDDLEKIDAFLHGVEITGRNDVYRLRSKLFKLKGYIIRNL